MEDDDDDAALGRRMSDYAEWPTTTLSYSTHTNRHVCDVCAAGEKKSREGWMLVFWWEIFVRGTGVFAMGIQYGIEDARRDFFTGWNRDGYTSILFSDIRRHCIRECGNVLAREISIY